MNALNTLLLSLVLALAVATTPASAQTKPRLGFSTAVSVSGEANPTIGKLTVSSVAKGSPAEIAGLRQGDEILEVNGKPAVGTPAADLAASIKGTQSGAHLRFKVKRADGTMAAIDIVAG